jgi:hypothetical protein
MTPGLLSCSNLVDAVECLELPQDQTSPSVALMSQNDPKRTSVASAGMRRRKFIGLVGARWRPLDASNCWELGPLMASRLRHPGRAG